MIDERQVARKRGNGQYIAVGLVRYRKAQTHRSQKHRQNYMFNAHRINLMFIKLRT